MYWRRVDPVQAVDALLMIGEDAPDRLSAALAGKPAFIRELPTAIGEGWAAIFARPLPGEEEALLPRLAGTCPLYQAHQGWWFPVGCILDAPEAIQADLLRQFAAQSNIAAPLIIVPNFGDALLSRIVDVYPVHLRIMAESV